LNEKKAANTREPEVEESGGGGDARWKGKSGQTSERLIKATEPKKGEQNETKVTICRKLLRE
jgi:hypothetical protein